jgi:hypothetical protein
MPGVEAAGCVVVGDARPRDCCSRTLCCERSQHNVREQLLHRRPNCGADASCLAIAFSCTQNMLRDRAVMRALAQHKMVV